MKVILHVHTKDLTTPWVIHYEDKEVVTHKVLLMAPSWTRNEGHTPCANWYIESKPEKVEILEDGSVVLD